MPAQRKIDIVASLKEKLREAQAVVLADYSGLTHPQLEDLRKSLKNLKAQFIVVKNSLLRLALKGIKYPTFVKTTAGRQVSSIKIEGPTAILFTTTEDLSPIKVIHNKGQELNALKIKGGIWERKIVDQDQIVRLATLPGREVLLSQVSWGLKFPLYALLYSIGYNLNRLVQTLGQIKNKKNNTS